MLQPPTAVTVFRGFNVSVSNLDAFLFANEVSATYGTPPYYPQHPDRATDLFFSKMGESGDKTDYRVIIPQRVGYNSADTAYITYSWFMVFAQRELRSDGLPSEVPPAFKSLRDEVLSFSQNPKDEVDGQMGLYVVFTEENTYMPDEMRQRNLIRDIKCDFCDMEWIDTRWAWKRWQIHHVEDHGVNESPNPLPQA